jgi:hypothetical protein
VDGIAHVGSNWETGSAKSDAATSKLGDASVVESAVPSR